MRIGIISDVHANSTALKAVRRHGSRQMQVERWISLGDTIGYNPFPVETVKLLMDMIVDPGDWLLGNHEVILLNLASLAVSEDTAFTLRDNRQLLQQDTDLWKKLQELWTIEKSHARRCVEGYQYWFCHAAFPRVENIWLDQVAVLPFPWGEDNGFDAKENIFQMLNSYRKGRGPSVYFHGHTHIPYAKGHRHGADGPVLLPIQYANKPGEFKCSLTEFESIIICFGSVGQPRNPDDPHAAYGVLDTADETFQFCRVPYPYEWVTNEMKKREYPQIFIDRLEGYYPDSDFWRKKGLGTKIKWDSVYKEREDRNGWDVV